ncbi:hypothetical protein VC83_03093 [Pseudogymnoascus destructans]|uniref:Uncharacterized protein n=1 Tax=Pseudogymnoascus destructans TaxID=655981 RepID=A0A177AG38_9PEZI|nr:uncharacterized protein VC83_03093 [Pseudogymnoascus destructans]OAF60221.2 hypothetical protein VC83_03093 [Pseudogymnoascus destructans]
MIPAMDIIIAESAISPKPVSVSVSLSPKQSNILLFTPPPNTRRPPKRNNTRLDRNENRAGKTNTQDQYVTIYQCCTFPSGPVGSGTNSSPLGQGL